MNNAYLTGIIDLLDEVSADIKTHLSELSYDQINWKPDASQWSVGQCIDHLVTTNSRYFEKLQGLTQGQHKKNFWERLGLMSGFFGRFILKSVIPGSKKNKTLKVFEPRQSDIPLQVFDEFEQCQEKLKNYISDLDHLDHEKYIISSPAGDFVTYNLKDVFNIIAQHEKRHFLQALNLTTHEQFPKV